MMAEILEDLITETALRVLRAACEVEKAVGDGLQP